MIHGPQEYAALSSAARKFINSGDRIIPKATKTSYEYLSAGANLPKLPAAQESKIHKYLSPSAISEKVNEEFGQVLDLHI